MIKLLFILTCCVLISCSQVKEEKSNRSVVGPQPPTLPYWVTSPPNTGELVVAIVPLYKSNYDKEYQLKAAILDAKAQLARNRSSYIIDKVEISQSSNRKSEKTKLTQIGEQRSSQNLNFSSANIIDQYTSDNGDLYILYGFE